MSTFLINWPELFTLNAGQFIKLERCQQWFLKNIFYVPNFAPNSLLLKLSGLNSIESEIVLGAFDHLAKMAPIVRFLFSSTVESFFMPT